MSSDLALEELLRRLRARHAVHVSERPPRAWCFTEELVLCHGRAWQPVGRSDQVEHGDLGHCFPNAYEYVIDHQKDVSYVEGFGLGPTDGKAEPHAWAGTNDGEILDPTWQSEGLAYFGIALPLAVMDMAHLVRHQNVKTALFDSFEQGVKDLSPLLEVKPWSLEAAHAHLNGLVERLRDGEEN
jgi:hypothetical protein